jgi:YHS domain-containing protein
MKLCNRKFLFVFLFIGVAAAFAACSNTNSFAKVNTGSDRLAIKGFDTVAYFAVGSAAKGNPKYEFVWNGAKWLFTNAENLERFRQDPEAYAPQFGGYCSYAVSKGYTADGEPEAWKVVDGKLYLNYNKDVRSLWERDENANIEKGVANWAAFEANPPVHK